MVYMYIIITVYVYIYTNIYMVFNHVNGYQENDLRQKHTWLVKSNTWDDDEDKKGDTDGNNGDDEHVDRSASDGDVIC